MSDAVDGGDLILRLREMRGAEPEPGYETYELLCQEAAEEITRLRVESERKRQRYNLAVARVSELEAENAVLREALEPFANIPPVAIDTAKHYWCVIGSPDRTHFTREDLERARAAYFPNKHRPPEKK